MVFAVVAIQLIRRTVDGEASLRDAIAIAANRVAHAAVIGEIAFQIVKAQRNVIQHTVAIRHDDVGENRAVVDDAHRRAARVGQGELRDVMPVRRNAERFFRYSHCCRLLLQNKRLFFCTVSISAIQKSVNLYPENFGERTRMGLIHFGFFKSVSRFTKKKLSAFAELFSLVRETGLDSRGSTPLGQRRSQAPLGLDSLRLLQVRFPSLQKRSPTLSPSFLLWCGKQDLNLHEIAFTRT